MNAGQEEPACGVPAPHSCYTRWMLRTVQATRYVTPLREGGSLPALVESMVDWCLRGPAGARVDKIEVVWLEPAGASDFEIRW